MMIYHFVLALLLAVLVMPKSPPSLNELNDKIVKKWDKEPTYIVEMDGELFELDPDKRRLINSRWIDKLEMVESSLLPDMEETEEDLIFMVQLKKRKEDDFRIALEVRSMELQALEVRR